MNKTECKSKFLHLWFSSFLVGRVFMIASYSGKKFKVYVRSKVRGFDGTFIHLDLPITLSL
jgi:hypothetical protein